MIKMQTKHIFWLCLTSSESAARNEPPTSTASQDSLAGGSSEAIAATIPATAMMA